MKRLLPNTIGYVCFGILADGTRIEACCRAPLGLMPTLEALAAAGAVTVGYGSRLELAPL